MKKGQVSIFIILGLVLFVIIGIILYAVTIINKQTVAAEERILRVESAEEPVEGAPKFLDEAHRYRFTYDPSKEATEWQSNAKQAIMCPHCKAALGIPPTRPIRITCPSCMMDTTFEK